MASGKTFQLGSFKINFSGRGIAAKRTDSDQIWRLPFPWSNRPDRRAYAGPYEHDDQEYETYGDNWYDAKWFMWLMLIALPPVGIWLLWRNHRFDLTIRSAVSAASAIWLVIILVSIFSQGGGTPDRTAFVPGVSATPSAPIESAPVAADATSTPAVAATLPASVPTPSVLPTSILGLTPAPSVTPGFLPGTGTSTNDEAPTPTPTTLYAWATALGTHYHKLPSCSGMKNAQVISVAAAIARGQTACPVCWDGTGAVSSSEVSAGTATSTAKTPTYYATRGGQYYHRDKTCSGMKGADAVTPATAVKNGQTACPKCVTKVFATQGGTYYHATTSCSGMQNAKEITLSRAKSDKKTACPTCIGKAKAPTSTASSSTSSGTSSSSAAYYATVNGKHYHLKSDCSGMQGATRVSLSTARDRGQTACPVCVTKTANAGTTATTAQYYSTANGKYYHKTATCTGMRDADKITLATARDRGQVACPKCLGTTAAYYATKEGKYYHKTSTCSGMRNASRVSVARATANGQTACPVCLKNQGATPTQQPGGDTGDSSQTLYYGTPNGQYFHKTATCSGMRDAVKVTLAQARNRGQTPCPKCLKALLPTATPRPSTTPRPTGAEGTPRPDSNDKIKVWVTIEGSKYHSKQYCSGMRNAASTTLTWALRHNYSRCTVCDAPKPVS